MILHPTDLSDSYYIYNHSVEDNITAATIKKRSLFSGDGSSWPPGGGLSSQQRGTLIKEVREKKKVKNLSRKENLKME